jgi:hypothetical protein
MAAMRVVEGREEKQPTNKSMTTTTTINHTTTHQQLVNRKTPLEFSIPTILHCLYEPNACQYIHHEPCDACCYKHCQ